MRFISVPYLSLLFVIGFIFSCSEPYDFEDNSVAPILIVDGAITNLVKKHKIYLSRSYSFDGKPEMEPGAFVSIKSDKGELFNFVDKGSEGYEAEKAFSAQKDTHYTLHIITTDGSEYQSTPMNLPNSSRLESVTTLAEKNDRGEDGIAIYVNALSDSNDARLYRFEYEETYKIIAPEWTPYDAVVIFEGISAFSTNVILRETEERVCYGTDNSKKIMLRSTKNQILDKIDQERIRFIPISDSKLMYRYSILVRLLVESQETYSYFETLQDLSVGSSSFFTEKQPGYIAGNVFNREDDEERVGGFFRVSAASEKRIFFSLDDYYPDAPQPEYFTSCIKIAPTAEGTRGNRNLLNIIYSGYGRFYQYNSGEMPGGPYIFVNAPCGDCTVLGSNKRPIFWEP